MNIAIARVAFLTITRKELVRIFRIWTQTLLPPVITQSLYFVIFGGLLGSQIGQVSGMSYAAFLVPGLILMTVLTNAFSNVVSSFFGAKFMRSVDEMLTAPIPPSIIIAGFCMGGIVRAVVVGLIVYAVSLVFAPPAITHVWAVAYFGIMTAVVFSLLGFLNALFAKKFDDVGIVPTFVLTPLTYLGGVFYSIDQLPGVWQQVARLNPLAYMIDGFRYGFSGVATTPVQISAVIIAILAVVLSAILLKLVRQGYGLKS